MIPREIQKWVAVGAMVVALIFIVLFLSWCSEMRRKETADAQHSMADARTGAATDASQVRDRADARTNQIDDTVKGATDEVRNAPDPAAGRRAARNGVCRVDPTACAR